MAQHKALVLFKLNSHAKMAPDRRGLDEAVNAYRAALLELTRERVPLLRARAQINLGTALANFGEREASEASANWFEQAVEAYRAALQELKRERVPLEWAMTQNNLGMRSYFWASGRAERGGSKRPSRPIKRALEEYTRERVPLDWGGSLRKSGSHHDPDRRPHRR